MRLEDPERRRAVDGDWTYITAENGDGLVLNWAEEKRMIGY